MNHELGKIFPVPCLSPPLLSPIDRCDERNLASPVIPAKAGILFSVSFLRPEKSGAGILFSVSFLRRQESCFSCHSFEKRNLNSFRQLFIHTNQLIYKILYIWLWGDGSLNFLKDIRMIKTTHIIHIHPFLDGLTCLPEAGMILSYL